MDTGATDDLKARGIEYSNTTLSETQPETNHHTGTEQVNEVTIRPNGKAYALNSGHHAGWHDNRAEEIEIGRAHV